MALTFGGGPAPDPGGLPPPLPSIPAVTRYIAPETGDDTADGLTPATAWRNPPRGSGASAAALAYVPVPGDHFGFKGGEVYRGRILPSHSGTVEAPIIYSGNAWGAGRCVWSGAIPVTTRAPIDTADAGGWAGWSSPDALIAEWTPDGRATWLHDAAGVLAGSQNPRPADPVLFDDILAGPGLWYDVDGARVNSSSEIEDAVLAGLLAGEVGRAAVWVWRTGSQFARCGVAGVTGNVVTLSGMSGAAYTPTTRVFIRNRLADVALPGDWSEISPGKAVLLRRSAGVIARTTYFSADPNTSGAIRATGATNNIVVRGFTFSGWAEASLISFGTSGVNWTIIDNRFIGNADGSGIVGDGCTGMQAAQNRFEACPLFNCLIDHASAAAVEYNVMTRCGATNIKSNRDDRVGAVVRRNIISFSNGVHANGHSVYGTQRDVLVEENCIFETERPLTHQSGSARPVPNSLRRWIGNVYFASVTAQRRSVSGVYGFRTNGTGDIEGYSLTGNIATGDPYGVLLNPQASGVVLTGNWSSGGINVAASSPDMTAGWTVSGNVTVSASYAIDSGAVLTADLVDVPRPDGTRLTIDLRAVGI